MKVFSWAVGYKLRSIYPSGTAEQWFCVWLIESKGILGRRILVWNAVHHNRTLKCRINEGFFIDVIHSRVIVFDWTSPPPTLLFLFIEDHFLEIFISKIFCLDLRVETFLSFSLSLPF